MRALIQLLNGLIWLTTATYVNCLLISTLSYSDLKVVGSFVDTMGTPSFSRRGGRQLWGRGLGEGGKQDHQFCWLFHISFK